MTREEILRRFRWVAIGYVVVAATLVAGIGVDWHQTASIRSTQDALKKDTTQLAQEIATGQTYLCSLISSLVRIEHIDLTVYCVTQQQRYQAIVSRLSTP
jgi:uncharacterized circularly permuted ATP-grasp superfamily protein